MPEILFKSQKPHEDFFKKVKNKYRNKHDCEIGKARIIGKVLSYFNRMPDAEDHIKKIIETEITN